MVSVMGFDGIWMDLEHHSYSLETAGNFIRATRVGSADILARAAKGEFMRIGRLLEMGAQGIMYPRCSDASEAEEVVRWAKFAPLGERGFDGAGADAFYTGIPMDEYVRDANEETFVVIQLEDPKAIEQAEAIARPVRSSLDREVIEQDSPSSSQHGQALGVYCRGCKFRKRTPPAWRWNDFT